MKFYEILTQVIGRLVCEQRVSYRALRQEFALDDEGLEALKDELIFAKQLAVDEDGRVLVWTGAGSLASKVPSPESKEQSLESSVQSPEAAEQRRIVTGQTLDPTLSDSRLTAAERRQLTVMFCDLVGSTTLSSQLDPEDLREVMRAYQETAAAVIARYEGHIAQYLGDGLLVYFGYPRAHEDDAQRAVRAGLEIIEAMGALNAQLEPAKGVRLAVRLGIHTGLVVVGEIGGGDRRERLALGETPNVAARLQGLAEPDTVVISAATARLVRETFVLETLGTQSVKGVKELMEVARVLAPREEQPEEEETALTEGEFLVGRDEEIGLLRRRWEQSKEGQGQVVLISGDAGIGKSALVERLRVDVQREGATRILFRCSPYHQHSALYPVIEHMQRLLRWQRDDPPAARLEKLERLLGTYQFPQEETVPLFAALLSLPLPEGRYSSLALAPQQQKQHMHDALAAWLAEETERNPVMVSWEDLHWADPSSLELLGLIIEEAPTIRMLNVLTFRSEFVPPWSARTHVTSLMLNRLEQRQVEAMVTQRAGGKPVPAAVVQHVVNKADGVPLFVEELMKMVLESGILKQEDGRYVLNGPLSTIMIPSTLQDSLMARLDRLPQVREIAQLGAVLGREFAYEMLKALTTVEEGELQQRLTQLVESELFYQRGRPPRAKYVFKHALLQDAAYASLLRSSRQHYHQQIAQLFERQFPEMVETQPELIAHHYTEARCLAQAIPYWQRAGQRAVLLSADTEAINHLMKGLKLLAALPDTPERARRELDLRITLGPALMATKGLAAPDVAQTYLRARELCVQLSETTALSPPLVGLSTFYLTRGEFQTARELGEQLLHLGQETHDSALLVEAHSVLGTTLFHLGELGRAREHLERGIALYDPRQHRFLAFRYGQDPGVFCLCYMVRMLWFLGAPDQARQRSHDATTLAQEIAHPFSLALAYTFAALGSQLRREGQTTQEWAEQAMVVCTKHGFAFYSAMGAILRGWALVEQGQGSEGIEQLRHGLAAWQATGSELFRPHLLALLAEAYGRVGEAKEGLAVLANALPTAPLGGMRFYEAELHRLKGELTLQQFKVQSSEFKVPSTQHPTPSTHAEAEAEACFLKAIEVARQQQAKSWELRASTSLARLWRQQGKLHEARAIVSEIYNCFTEGFDTKDLQEAKALLEEPS